MATESTHSTQSTGFVSSVESARSAPDTRNSATLDAVTHTASGTAPGRRNAYGTLWRSVPRDLGFLLLTLPIVVVGFTVLVTLFSTGISLIALFIGLFIVVAALYVARGFGALELIRLRWAGQPAITPPRWETADAPMTPLRTILGPLVNGHYWLYLLHGMVVNFLLGLVSWIVTVVWVSVSLGGVTFWLWGRALSPGDRTEWLSQTVLGWLLPNTALGADPFVAESIVQFVVGAVFLVTLPLVTHGLTVLHHLVARGMLGAWASEALQREVADLSASRGAAVAAEDQSLRRLERDIHDGPQQRLVRLQMDIASAERKLDTDPEAARTLLREARGQAHDTLEELRALSRGLVPPILQDRGLVTGLESLAARSTIPVQLELNLDPELRLPSEIERSAYFVASELLTNAAKHSGATAVRLHAALRRVPDGDTTWLDLWVIDNGRGGATLTPGHGLSGLDERLRGLLGVLSVDSPAGGPTAVGAHIPLTTALDSSLALS